MASEERSNVCFYCLGKGEVEYRTDCGDLTSDCNVCEGKGEVSTERAVVLKRFHRRQLISFIVGIIMILPFVLAFITLAALFFSFDGSSAKELNHTNESYFRRGLEIYGSIVGMIALPILYCYLCKLLDWWTDAPLK